jgi:hypothetical protein
MNTTIAPNIPGHFNSTNHYFKNKYHFFNKLIQNTIFRAFPLSSADEKGKPSGDL